MTLSYHPIPTDHARHLQQGGADANNQPAEHDISDGNGNPCRHCLKNIPQGAKMLICAYRPFPAAQPYAEIGPIFLCADECTSYDAQNAPDVLKTSATYLIRGYTADNRIAYGTGKITAMADLATASAKILNANGIAYVHVRSASNNCFQCKITLE
ncbi:MAG: DUF1203 domain-containing protein [Rhodobacteraceae bacterium]|nr:DUF1203 domain-containing protein [Paracoccaceae bacterium]